jgi:ubiquinone/menaquinone biosynthesis C-methylase UbiE
MKHNINEIDIQREYYKKTAHQYESKHVNTKDEHYLSLSIMSGFVDFLEAKSVLDIGSGTGRALKYLQTKKPSLKVMGVEPVEALREQGYQLGLDKNDLIDGDANSLQFEDNAFDIVSEFGVLHHVPKPEKVVSEMLRVARLAIVISDTNNFGQGGTLNRIIKHVLNFFSLWKIANWLKTGGKKYTISEGDGLAYSYSVFNNYKQINKVCKAVYVINVKGGGKYPFQNASHVLLIGIKK